MHSLLRPRWILGHLLVLVAVVGFVVLGMWQLRRHSEKVELRDQVTAAVSQPGVPIASVPEGAFTRVSVAGSFDATYEQLIPRSRDGASGYEVLTPLLLDPGGAVLVDRGWVAIDEVVPKPPVRFEGEGVLWPGESGSRQERFNEYSTRVDPSSLAEFTGYPLRPEYLVAIFQEPPVDLAPPEIGEVSLGPHLGYAGQWFLFALVVAVGYPLLIRRTLRPTASDSR